MDTLQIRGGILLRSSARLRSFAHPLDSMLCMLILLCMVILLLCVVILQDEGACRGGDPAKLSCGVHGREHFQHRDPKGLPHHLCRPLKGIITTPL